MVVSFGLWHKRPGYIFWLCDLLVLLPWSKSLSFLMSKMKIIMVFMLYRVLPEFNKMIYEKY